MYVLQYAQNEKALFRAADTGDVPAVRQLIQTQVNVNAMQVYVHAHAVGFRVNV